MRDLVIGVTVVLPDGTRASSGGKVVKNVAGYDLGKLFCGSRGPARHASSGSRCACIRCRRRRARSSDARRLGAAPPLAARAERGRHRRRTDASSSSRGRSARSTRRRAQLGGEEAEPWDELRALQADAARPRALGRRGRAARPARARASPTSRSAASQPGARSPSASWRRCAARADRRLRPLRLLPADVPDVLALARGDGLAARAHHLMAGLVDGSIAVERHGRRALRPLPRLHGVRACVPVGRAVRPADRADARLRRAAPSAARLGERLLRAAIFAVFPHRRRLRAALAFRRLPAPGPFAPLEADRAAVVGAEWPPEHLPGDGRASRVLAGCVASVVFGDVNAATARVLHAEGYDVHVPRAQGCCGALHAHAGGSTKASRVRMRSSATSPATTTSSRTRPAAART